MLYAEIVMNQVDSSDAKLLAAVLRRMGTVTVPRGNVPYLRREEQIGFGDLDSREHSSN